MSGTNPTGSLRAGPLRAGGHSVGALDYGTGIFAGPNSFFSSTNATVTSDNYTGVAIDFTSAATPGSTEGFFINMNPGPFQRLRSGPVTFSWAFTDSIGPTTYTFFAGLTSYNMTDFSVFNGTNPLVSSGPNAGVGFCLNGTDTTLRIAVNDEIGNTTFHDFPDPLDYSIAQNTVRIDGTITPIEQNDGFQFDITLWTVDPVTSGAIETPWTAPLVMNSNVPESEINLRPMFAIQTLDSNMHSIFFVAFDGLF